MVKLQSRSFSPIFIYGLVTISGLASLSWEVLWQIKSSLALGVSAWGTALTLAITMGGMSIGALLTGSLLKSKSIIPPLRLYGIFEILIGAAGLLLHPTFREIEKLDSLAYTALPGSAPLVHTLGIIGTLGLPAICMGATLPVFGLIARQFRTSIAMLYGLNTLGAAGGALLAAFFFIPELGLIRTAWIIAALNIAVGLTVWLLPAPTVTAKRRTSKTKSSLSFNAAALTVGMTGFATFALEIAWFRSLTAAFQSTTDAFAIMLAAVLIALGAAARLVPRIKSQIPLGTLVTWAGILILLATPVIERFDILPFFEIYPNVHLTPAVLILNRFILTLCVIGPPILLLGMAVPWLLDEEREPRRWGFLYGLNTLAAIAGSIGAAWILLPLMGFARTAWLVGTVVALTGIFVAPPRNRILWVALGIAGFLAVTFESGVGTTRAQGQPFYDTEGKPARLLESYEGPDVTTSVAEYENGGRRLIIDGASTTGQSGRHDVAMEHYMTWMGHLPMLLHPDPQNALVICFGTGQTANAVRHENPQVLDVVDINPNVFKLAHNFSANQHVLNDPRANVIVMDGRAWIRRTSKTYDVITLEPMPPVFAGVNALYSREFYELAREKLTPDGIIAQWLPFRALSPHYNASIARTFADVFPNSILWIDPVTKTGILLGSKDDSGDLGADWPGFARTSINRNMSEAEVQDAVKLDRKELKRYGKYGELITDDNQLLAYGPAVYSAMPAVALPDPLEDNFDLLDRVHRP